MARRVEVLTKIMTENRTRSISAQISNDQFSPITNFSISLTPADIESQHISETNSYAKIIVLGIDISIFQKEDSNPIASINIEVDGKATCTIATQEEQKVYDDLLKSVITSSYEYGKNKISALLYDMNIYEIPLPAINQRKLINLYKEVESVKEEH